MQGEMAERKVVVGDSCFDNNYLISKILGYCHKLAERQNERYLVSWSRIFAASLLAGTMSPQTPQK